MRPFDFLRFHLWQAPLARAVRNSVTIDWTVHENDRAHMRVLIERILRRYG